MYANKLRIGIISAVFTLVPSLLILVILFQMRRDILYFKWDEREEENCCSSWIVSFHLEGASLVVVIAMQYGAQFKYVWVCITIKVQ